MTTPDEPAFPAEPKTQNDLGVTYRGMTKREWLAGMIIGSFMIAAARDKDGDRQIPEEEPTAQLVLKYADALIAALNKKP